MRKHCQTEHPQFKCKKPRAASVQALFSYVGKAFFTVNPTLALALSPSNAYSFLLQSVLPSFSPPVGPEQDPPPVSEREVPPFYRVTRWPELLGDIMHSRELRNKVISLAALPSKEEEYLQAVPQLCLDYLIEGMQAANDAGYSVKRRLVPEE